MTIKEYKNLFKTELLEFCVPFWLSNGADKEFGGIINCLDRKGEIYSTDKSVWMQGRAGWTFSYIYNNIKKDPQFLVFAKSCIDFAKKYCIDSDQRMFFTVTREGKPLRKRRYWFSETFYCIANAEYFKATGDIEYKKEALKYFDFVYSMYIDPSVDPYKITPKAISQTRELKSKANPMIMLNVASIVREIDIENQQKYNNIISGLIEDIACFYKPEYNATFESLTLDNCVVLESAPCRVINPGHDIECSWFLLEEGIKRGDQKIIDLAQTIFNTAFNRGWDKEYGGIIYFKDVLDKPVEAYEHDMKLWWPQNETIIASLMFYLHTRDKEYLEKFKLVTEYAFEHFSDREYGEWYGYLHRDGTPTLPACKGHTYKGPFHVMRMLAKCIVMLKDEQIKEKL